MSDNTHNGDEQIQPGDTGMIGGAIEDSGIAERSADTMNAPGLLQAVEASETPPDGMHVEMLEDQPVPEEPVKVDPTDRRHDALIGLTNAAGGLNFHVMITTEKPDPDNNLAHFFSQFLARAFPWLMEQAAREFTLAQQNAALTERSRIKLVSIDGKPLGG